MSEKGMAKISVATATIIGMNAMIGSGIFTAPAALGAQIGPAGIVAYIFVVIAVLFIALSLGRLAALFPQEGSFYVYTKPWGGHVGGLIASGSYFIGLIIAMGALTQVAGLYLDEFFPSLSAHTLGIIMLTVLVALNLFGVVMSQMGQHILIVCTVFPLIVTTILCFLHMDVSKLFPFMPHGMTSILKATRIVIFGFFGFECAASLFNIVQNPEKNVPRALTYSIVIVGLIYTLFIMSIILSTPMELFISPNIRVPDIIKTLFPHAKWLIMLVHISILSAITGTIHSMIWASSNLLATLVKPFQGTGMYHIARIITPRRAVLCVGAGILINYLLIHNIDLFFYLTAFFVVLAFIMSMITLLTLKKEWRNGHNIKTVIGLLTALIIFGFAAEGLIQEIIRPEASQSPIVLEPEAPRSI